MSDTEVVEMMIALVQMNEKHFQECVTYVANTVMPQKVRDLLEKSLDIARRYRIKRNVEMEC